MFLCVSAGSSLRRFGQSIKRIVREVEQQESGGDDDGDVGHDIKLRFFGGLGIKFHLTKSAIR